MLEIDVAPIVSDYIVSPGFVDLIIGPIGSGKTLGSILKWEKLIYEQEPSDDGIRHTRLVVVRNTAVELRDTTIKSFLDHFGDQLVFNTGNLTALYEHDDVKAEILFRALDKPEDMKKLLSLEITFAYLNELRELPKEALENVTSRLGRYPSPKKGARATNPSAWADTNAFDQETWIYEKFISDRPYNHHVFEQPPAIINAVFRGNKLVKADINPDAENLKNLPAEYYRGFIAGKSEDWVKVMIMRKYIPLQTGKPVYPEFNDQIHCVDELDIRPPDKSRPLICGGDNGRWSGFLIGQMDPLGRLVVFDEILSDDINLTIFSEILAAHMKANYDGYEFETWIDPWAANQRGQLTDMTMFKAYNNALLHPRVSTTGSPTTMQEAVKKELGTIRVGQPAIIISSKCKMLRKGLNGSYQYKRVNVSGERYAEKADKGSYSHICNAFEFLLDGTGASREMLSSSKFKKMAQSGPIRVNSNYDPLG